MRRKRASVSVCHQATQEPGGRHERDQSARPRNTRRAKGEREPAAAAATTSPIDKLNATGRGRIPQAVTTRTQASPKRNTQGGSRDRREHAGVTGAGEPPIASRPSLTRPKRLRHATCRGRALPDPCRPLGGSGQAERERAPAKVWRAARYELPTRPEQK